jgi:hypothetical protein
MLERRHEFGDLLRAFDAELPAAVHAD